MTQTAVLIQATDGSCNKLVRIPVEPSDTVAGLKRRVADSVGVSIESIQQIIWGGQEVADQDKVATAGINTTATDLQSADDGLFPNCWFSVPYTKSYKKVLDPTWPPVRHADYTISIRWLALLMLLLFITNIISP
eukprot:jgi/Chrzof1/426/Cz01g15140.t1